MYMYMGFIIIERIEFYWKYNFFEVFLRLRFIEYDEN